MVDIANRVAHGEVLRDVLAEEGYPSYALFWRWLSENERAAELWAQARELAGHTFAGEVLKVTRETHKLTLPPDVARVVSANYQWLAAKFAPRHYSERFGQVQGLQLVINTTLDLAPGQRGQDLSEQGSYVLVAHTPPGEGEPPIEPLATSPKSRGSRRPRRTGKNKNEKQTAEPVVVYDEE